MPKFNKKDYNFVAKRLRENFPSPEASEMSWYDKRKEVQTRQRIVAEVAIDFAKAYKKDNPQFDPLQFLDACSSDVDRFPLSELWEDEEDNAT
jgi:hypothetical protein